VVTGATGGIGLWTALGLARAGAEVVIVGRSPGRLAEAARWIAAQTGGIAPRTELADFASLRAVHDLAARLAQRLEKLDILVNNAGLITARRMVSQDGYELIFAVNHLAPFLLTQSLLPLLQRGSPARIVTVASTAHQRGRIHWDDLMLQHGWSPMRAYAQSKLANILFTVALAKRLDGTGITANSVHPGVVGSGFGNVGGLYGFGWRLAKPFLLTPEQGARTSLYAATAPELAGVSGRYFARNRPATPRPQARDAAAAERLWGESEALVAQALA
jgi:NAD(P)-dependent dehydrogenase (short-subunit alcohol dehydrogenase family)